MRTPRPVYKLMRHKTVVAAVFLFLLPMMTLYAIKPLLAAPVYTLTPQAPGRTQEGNSIVLTLSLTGGLGSQPYTFNITVTQPDASTHTAQASFTTDGSGAGSVSKSYASDFNLPTLGNTNFVGTYSIAVIQTGPSGALNPVATGSFTVGLTDKATYQRTQTVLIQATGYGNRENVTVDIMTGGTTHAAGFPQVVTASSGGLVATSWHIPLNALAGTWTVTASGTTVKSPADQQTMTITAATLIVTVTTDQSIYARGQTITAYATVRYPDGTVMNNTSILGSFPTVQVTFTNGSNNRAMAWNATAQNWHASYASSAFINPANLPQAWVVSATASDRVAGTPNTGNGQTTVTIRLVPATPDLLITVMNATGPVPGVPLNITFTNGTIVIQSVTDASGSASFTLPTGYSYWLVASPSGYDDYLDTFFLPSNTANCNNQGTIVHCSYTLNSVLYHGSVLSGSFTTQANYIPGQSGQLEIWIYNQNITFTLTVTKIEVQFPWFATYGNSYQGNVTVSNLPATIKPLTNWNTTVPFTVPNDGRLYSGSGGAIYITAHISAWKTAWVISTTGVASHYRVLDTAYINPYNNPYYDSRGFLAYPRITVAFPTQDTAAAGDLNIIEILAGISILNVVFLALIWMRLKPQGVAAAIPKA